MAVYARLCALLFSPNHPKSRSLSLIRPHVVFGPPGSPDRVRKNLTLRTTNGYVTAETWIRHYGNTESNRVSMDLSTDNGAVHATVLPRYFRGPITIGTRDDRIAFSPGFEKRTALISDVSGDRVYFVGDQPRGGRWGNGDNSNDGRKTVEDLLDEISVDGRYTSVRVNWDGDEEVPFCCSIVGGRSWLVQKEFSRL